MQLDTRIDEWIIMFPVSGLEKKCPHAQDFRRTCNPGANMKINSNFKRTSFFIEKCNDLKLRNFTEK